MKQKERILCDLVLSEKRRKHTEGVVKAALLLAERHFPEIDPESAELAALMHDFTKEYPAERQLALCGQYGIALSESEQASPKLLHARTAAAIAEAVYRLPPEICSAIRWHTTGKPDMAPLETVLYFADYIEENRTFPACVKLRDFYEKQYRKREDKRKALLLGLERSFDLTIRDLLADKKPIDGTTVEARNWYLGLILQGSRKGKNT